MTRAAVLCRILAPFLLLMSSLGCSPRDAEPPQPDTSLRTVTLDAGDTLGESLLETGLIPAEQEEIVRRLSTLFSPRLCRAGDCYELQLDGAGRWESFRYYPSGMEYFAVERSTDGTIAVGKRTVPSTKVVAAARGTLRTSLWESMSAQGLSPELIVSFADIFAWQIDFLTEPRAGDSFKVVWEKFETANGTSSTGRILAAQYTASGQTYTAMLYTDANGRDEYYTPDGKSLRSAFLKAPLQFRRISSTFTRRRYHPVLKYFRPHLGIDYAAPRGTPVSAIGEGTVTFAGWKGGFGKYIAIRHANGYASFYGHLSRFGKGIHRGVRVRQGQVIGAVGSTGISTGPHLDFRMTKDGRFINFLKVRIPSAGSIGAGDQQGFTDVKRTLYTRLAEIH